MNWLTISINPPKLDVKIVAMTSDELGYGFSAKVFEFSHNAFLETRIR